MENALEEILKMMSIYGDKRGYALMNDDEIQISETEEKSEKSDNDNSVNFFYGVMIVTFIMFVIYGSLLLYYVKFKLFNIEETYCQNLL